MQKKFLYLYAWDFKKNSAYFVHVDREDLYKSSFLDQRIHAKDNTLVTKDIQTVLGNSIETHSKTPVFIFHTAFCCSTLLARSLDFPGKTLVLREPLTLLQLADLKRGFTRTPHEYNSTLARTMQLLTNSPLHEGKVIIKPTNLANNLIPDLIALYPNTRILLLHDNLEPFLTSVLKRPNESITGIQLFLKRFLADNPVTPQALDSQIKGKLHFEAALAWALQKNALNKIIAKQSGRIRTIHTSDFLMHPETVLPAITQWLKLDLDEIDFSSITSSPLWSVNAKHPDKRYSANQRAREQIDLQNRFSQAINEALSWLMDTVCLMPEPFPTNLSLLPEDNSLAS